eukprot:2928918-Karenia_brevis.AAC.1
MAYVCTCFSCFVHGKLQGGIISGGSQGAVQMRRSRWCPPSILVAEVMKPHHQGAARRARAYVEPYTY